MRSAALVIAIVAWGASARAERRSFDPASVYQVPRGQSPASGPSDAPVTIVAWSDYQCGYCNRVQSTLDHLARLYPGQLRWVHRTMPLDDENTMVSEAALAADAQGRFLPMNDRLYALGGRVDRPTVELLARELGLDLVRFRADLDSHAFRPAIDADMADARLLGVSGTPTFFINGRALFGNQPLPVFVEVVDQELARAAAQHAGYDALVASGKPTADAPSTTTNAHHPLEPTTTYRIGLGLPGHQSGPDNALLTLVVWSDFQCPYCAKQAPVLAELRARYKDEIRIVYRHLAMGFHRDAALAAEAAVAAAEQGKFWAFHDQVFANFGHLTRADLEGYAQAIGLDLPVFRAALDQRRYRDAIVAEGAAGEALGVDGTPTMFINGAPVVGARTAAMIGPLIEAHLARSRDVTSAGVAPADLYAMLMTGGAGDDRADPSRIPVPAAVHVEPRSDDRVRGVAAACRRRDAARATELAGALAGDARRRAVLVCSGAGIDLPPGK
ncbi:MAG: thioredoxin domain-containing protein [Kofleriaceae bacterium]